VPAASGCPSAPGPSDRPSGAERCRHLPVRGATPDHLAVIRPPAVTRLTARRRLRLDRPPHGRSWGRATGRLRVARRRAPALFRLTGPLSTDTSDTPSRAAGPGAASLSDRGSAPSCLIAVHPGHVNAGGWGGDRGAFHHTGPAGRSCESPARRAATGWPAGTAAARFHRCARHRLDLSSRRFRGTNRGRAHPCDFCRWNFSTSTTTDHPNISIRGIRGRDDCMGSTGSRLPSEAAAGAPRGQGSGKTDARHSRSRLLAPETSPQPRSPRAPRVARRHPSPVWSDAVRWGRCRRRAPLQGAPAGRVAWRRASAKRPSVDQPEVPSVMRAFASERARPASRSCQAGAGAFFTIVGPRGETPAFALDGSTARAGMANHPPSTRRSAPE
jgi:hypothetical protein